MFLKYLWAFLLGLVFFYLQVVLMPGLAIAGVSPNILLAWLIFNIWYRELNIACVSGFLVGLLYDVMLPATFGMNALLFVLLCLAVDTIRKPFEVDSVVAKILTLASANLIYTLLTYLVMGLSFGFDFSLFRLIGISFLYTLPFSFIVFWLLTFLSKLRLYFSND